MTRTTKTDDLVHPAIRNAAIARDIANSAVTTARRELAAVETPAARQAAEMEDAEDAADARAAGKPEPKRHYAIALDRKVDDARHKLRVLTLEAERAGKALAAAQEENRDEQLDILNRAVRERDAAYQKWASEGPAIHAGRIEALKLRREVGGASLNRSKAVVVLKRDDVAPVEETQGNRILRVSHVQPEVVFEALKNVAVPQAPKDLAAEREAADQAKAESKARAAKAYAHEVALGWRGSPEEREAAIAAIAVN